MFYQQKGRYPFEPRQEAFEHLKSYIDIIKDELENEGLWERESNIQGLPVKVC